MRRLVLLLVLGCAAPKPLPLLPPPLAQPPAVVEAPPAIKLEATVSIFDETGGYWEGMLEPDPSTLIQQCATSPGWLLVRVTAGGEAPTLVEKSPSIPETLVRCVVDGFVNLHLPAEGPRITAPLRAYISLR